MVCDDVRLLHCYRPTETRTVNKRTLSPFNDVGALWPKALLFIVTLLDALVMPIKLGTALQRSMARLHCALIGHTRNKEGSMSEQIQPSKGAPLFNPWSPEFIANPYPSYHLLRETERMHYMPLGLYIASRHADISTILRDKRFGKDFIGRMTRRAGPTNSRRTGLLQHEPLDAAARSARPRPLAQPRGAGVQRAADRRYAAAHSGHCR